MLFDLSNYLIFLALLSIVYVVAINFIQANSGGKNRLANLQKEMREVQLRMIEAGKKGDTEQSNKIMEEYWKLTGELFTIQMQMTVVVLVIFLGLMAIFPYLEPGMEDDISIPLYDDGMAAHCDAIANDLVFSSCFALPQGGVRGAWVVEAQLKSGTNETLARNGVPVYYEGGMPSDVWVQTASQSGFWDGIMGKKPYTLNVTTEPGENHTFASGETVAIRAYAHNTLFINSAESFASELSEYNKANQDQLQITYAQLSAVSREAALQNGTNITGANGKTYAVTRNSDGAFAIKAANMPLGGRIDAAANAGTFFHYDAPFTIPLINIRRIIGSYGVFIFIVFVTSIAYAVVKAIYSKLKK